MQSNIFTHLYNPMFPQIKLVTLNASLDSSSTTKRAISLILGNTDLISPHISLSLSNPRFCLGRRLVRPQHTPSAPVCCRVVTLTMIIIMRIYLFCFLARRSFRHTTADNSRPPRYAPVSYLVYANNRHWSCHV